MDRSLDIQTFGTALVIVAFVAGEIAAWYLSACPSCVFAWYLNLGPFRAFETIRTGSSPLGFLFTPTSLPAALAALLLLLTARKLKFRLAIAVAANLSFVVAAMAVSSNGALDLILSSEAVVVGTALLGSLVACAASHASFIAAIRSETLPNMRAELPQR